MTLWRHRYGCIRSPRNPLCFLPFLLYFRILVHTYLENTDWVRVFLMDEAVPSPVPRWSVTSASKAASGLLLFDECHLVSTWATFLRDGYAKVFTPLVNLLPPVIWLRCNAIKGRRFFDLVDSEGRDWRVGYHPYLRRHGCCQDSSGANESHPNCENWSESPRRDGRT